MKFKTGFFRALAPVGALLAGDALHRQPPEECAPTEWPVEPKPPRELEPPELAPRALEPRPTVGTEVWLVDGENRLRRVVWVEGEDES